jgi:hypothetical protein
VSYDNSILLLPVVFEAVVVGLGHKVNSIGYHSALDHNHDLMLVAERARELVEAAETTGSVPHLLLAVQAVEQLTKWSKN